MARTEHHCESAMQTVPNPLTSAEIYPWSGMVISREQRMCYQVLHGESSKRLATPRNTKDRKHLQSTQSAQPTNLTDQAPSTTERTARETHNTRQHSSRARFSTTTTHHQHQHPTGSSPDLFSQPSVTMLVLLQHTCTA